MASYIGNFARQFLKRAAMAAAGAATLAVACGSAYGQFPKPAFMETNASRISLAAPDRTLKGLTEAIPGADQYELAFDGPVRGSVRTPCNGFSTQVPNVPEGEYRVKMRALQAGNPVSDYSDPATVTVTAEPSTQPLSTSKPAFYVRRQTLNPGQDAEIYWFPPDGRSDNIYALSIAFPNGTRIEPRVRCNGLKLRVPDSVPLGRYDLSVAALSGGTAGEFEGPYHAWLTDEREMIVFSRKVGNNFEIFRINPDGTGERQLTQLGRESARPRLSPNRKLVVIQSGETGRSSSTRELYLMKTDGTELRRLTTNLFRDFDPFFYPNGTEIGFISDRDGGFEAYKMNLETGAVTRLTRDSFVKTTPMISPDGKTTVYAAATRIDLGDSKIYRMNADGTETVQLTNNGFRDLRPVFDPTGRIIYFERADGGSNIHKIDARGNNQSPVTTFGNNEVAMMPSVSPGGDRLTFTYGTPPTDLSAREIAVFNLQTGEITFLTRNLMPEDGPTWR